ncbi:MAG: protein-glutamate O-methyltransferase CheR [Lysobacterales bacterium]|nr:MAG: protein-glutamate O-methyltransferase CheR [Xanthomonadales bacterium]
MLTATDFDYVRRLVLERSAILLEPGKEYLVELRLKPIVRMRGLRDLGELVQLLRTDVSGSLQREVVEAMTTNETSFFRDVHPFETLRQWVLPELLRNRAAERVLNIWCGAASSGQEVYSIAMTLREHFPELAHWRVSIVATDLSREMILRCREARYSQLEINRGLPANLLIKYFERADMDWRIREDVRRMIDFREMNLAGNWAGLPVCDLVFLRNVLIYFDDATKRQILGKVRGLMRPGGYLFLGSSETTLNLDSRFEQVKFDRTLCYRVRA